MWISRTQIYRCTFLIFFISLSLTALEKSFLHGNQKQYWQFQVNPVVLRVKFCKISLPSTRCLPLFSGVVGMICGGLWASPSSEGKWSKAPPWVSSGLGYPLLNTHPTASCITGFHALLCSLMNLTPVLWGHHPTFSTSAVSLQGVKLPAAFPTLHGVCGRHPVRYT